MKKIILLLSLFFSLSFYGQNDTIASVKAKISLVSADKLNVVYRGIKNPISIAVSGAKSFTAFGQGLQIDNGKYYLTLGKGLEAIIKLNIVMNDNSEIIEEHIFRIKSLNPPRALINGFSCDKCSIEMTIEELETAEITVKIENFLIETNFEIKSFNVKFDNRTTIEVYGNKFNKNVLDKVKKLKNGKFIYLADFRTAISDFACGIRIHPIKIMIIDKEIEVNYYKSKEFIKDSLQKLRIESKLLKKEFRTK